MTQPAAALVDLNAHLLGMSSTDWALARVREAYADGVRVLYAVASHRDAPPSDVTMAHRRLQHAVTRASISVEIETGHQAMLHEGVAQDFACGRILPLGSSGYVFVELPRDSFPSYTLDVLYHLTLEGARLLLIHPELNVGLRQNSALVRKLREMEVVGVAAASHLRRRAPRDVRQGTLSLIESGLVQAVASHAGPASDRPARLSDVAPVLARHFGDDVAESLVHTTPQAIRTGLPIEMRPRGRRALVSWFS